MKNITQINRAMQKHIRDCIDECNEINYTKLAEKACAELNDYENDEDFTIPEVYFELAADFANTYTIEDNNLSD